MRDSIRLLLRLIALAWVCMGLGLALCLPIHTVCWPDTSNPTLPLHARSRADLHARVVIRIAGVGLGLIVLGCGTFAVQRLIPPCPTRHPS